MSRTYRAMARNYARHYDGYQDHVYGNQVMAVEEVRKLYRQYLRCELPEYDDEYLLSLGRFNLTPIQLAQHAHRTVFRNRCSYRQRMHAIRNAKKARRKTERAITKQKLYRDAEGFSMSRKDCK